MKTTSLLLLITLAFASMMPMSCKKNTIEYNFNGQTTGAISGTSINGVTVVIYQDIIQNGINKGFQLAGTDETSGAGDFEISFDRQMVTNFRFKFSKDDYFPIVYEESSAEFTTDGFNTVNQQLEPQCWIEFDIENLFPNETDHLKLVTQTFREGCDDCAENKTTDFFGAVDTLLRFATTANEYVKFTYINVSGGSSQVDSIFTTPFETIVYPISY